MILSCLLLLLQVLERLDKETTGPACRVENRLANIWIDIWIDTPHYCCWGCLHFQKKGERHLVMPLHASLIEQCRKIGFDNLTPIIWHKISNATFDVNNGGEILGKPYEPNAFIKNDIEFILMQRKSGAYRKPDVNTRILSAISQENHKKWFRQIWTDLTGASTKDHPAPFPVELSTRLIRMFSFVGDTVLDPFVGTGSTIISAAATGRNSIGIEVDPSYMEYAYHRILKQGIKVEKPQSLKRYQKNIIDF